MSIHAEADRISKASEKWSRIADDTVEWQQMCQGGFLAEWYSTFWWSGVEGMEYLFVAGAPTGRH